MTISLSTGLRTPWGPHSGAVGSGLGVGSLGLFTETAAPATQKKMEGFVLLSPSDISFYLL